MKHPFSLDAFRVGHRVEMHPATDQWMQGDRYGEVTRITKSKVHVRLEKSGHTLRVSPSHIGGIFYFSA